MSPSMGDTHIRNNFTDKSLLHCHHPRPRTPDPRPPLHSHKRNAHTHTGKFNLCERDVNADGPIWTEIVRLNLQGKM